MANVETREEGRTAALAVWALYLLSIPSFAAFALVGVIVAYASRSGATGLARAHMEDQIRIFWIAFWWAVGLAVLSVVAWALTVVLIGFALLWILGAIGFVVMIWFTIKSLFGLIRLLDNRAP